MLANGRWPSPKCRPQRPNRAWLAHGLPPETFQRAGSARNSFGTALRAAVGYARETDEEEARAYPIDPSAAKRAGAIGAEPVCYVVRWFRPCAVQAPRDLRGHSLQPGHSANRLCRGRCEVLRLGIAVSLVTFFAAAKKVTPAPGRGSANRPTRNPDSTGKAP